MSSWGSPSWNVGQRRSNSNRQLGELSAGVRLLGRVSSKFDREPGISAIVLYDTGTSDYHDCIRMMDLTRKCWEGETTEAVELLCRKLRFLHDTSKHDFLLRSCGDMMFVRSDFVRAVIEPHRVIFLGVESPTFDQFLKELVGEMENELAKGIHANDSDVGRLFNYRPFKIWLIECIICANVTLHNLRLQVLAPVAQSILDNIRLDRCDDAILQLYPVKMALSTFIEQVRPLVHCLLHGAEDEREARGKNPFKRSPHGATQFTSSWLSTPQYFSIAGGQGDGLPPIKADSHERQTSAISHHSDVDGRRRLSSEDHESVTSFPTERLRPGSLEEVLDNWLHNGEEMMADATELSNSMDDAIRFLEASMSCMRNKLLQLELGTETMALVFSLGALVSGIFGMNLHTGIENSPGYFVGVLLFIFVCGGIIIFTAGWIIWRSKRHYQDHSARFGNNKFFRSFGDDAYILGELGATISDAGSLPKNVLDRVLQDLQEPALPVQGRPSWGRPSSPRTSNDVALIQRQSSRNSLGTAQPGSGTFVPRRPSNSRYISPPGSNPLLGGSPPGSNHFLGGN